MEQYQSLSAVVDLVGHLVRLQDLAAHLQLADLQLLAHQ
jgi:hypothetical protein